MNQTIDEDGQTSTIIQTNSTSPLWSLVNIDRLYNGEMTTGSDHFIISLKMHFYSGTLLLLLLLVYIILILIIIITIIIIIMLRYWDCLLNSLEQTQYLIIYTQLKF